MADFLGQVTGLPKLFDILLLDGRCHPLASCSGSGHFRRTFVGGEDERSSVRAQVKENGRVEGEGVGEKGESLSPYNYNRDPAPPHLPGKLAYSPSAEMMAQLGYPYPY